MSHLNQEELVLIYYREPGVPANAASHLAECAQCRADFDALAETLNACLDWAPPEPPLDFGRAVWAGLAPQLVEQRRIVHPMRMWLAIAAAVVLLISAFVAGRASRPPRQPSQNLQIGAGLSPQARARIFAITMADHLDRAEVLLTEFENSDTFPDKARAKDLVAEGRLMRQMLASNGEAGSGETNLLPLLDDVERVVLEIANSPDKATPREMQDLKQSIGSGSLLFKVRIVESNLRSEGQKI